MKLKHIMTQLKNNDNPPPHIKDINAQHDTESELLKRIADNHKPNEKLREELRDDIMTLLTTKQYPKKDEFVPNEVQIINNKPSMKTNYEKYLKAQSDAIQKIGNVRNKLLLHLFNLAAVESESESEPESNNQAKKISSRFNCGFLATYKKRIISIMYDFGEEKNENDTNHQIITHKELTQTQEHPVFTSKFIDEIGKLDFSEYGDGKFRYMAIQTGYDDGNTVLDAYPIFKNKVQFDESFEKAPENYDQAQEKSVEDIFKFLKDNGYLKLEPNACEHFKYFIKKTPVIIGKLEDLNIPAKFIKGGMIDFIPNWEGKQHKNITNCFVVISDPQGPYLINGEVLEDETVVPEKYQKIENGELLRNLC